MNVNMEAHGHGQQAPHCSKHSDHWLGREDCIKEIEGEIHIPARATSIQWGDNVNFWKWTPLGEHEFKDKDKFGFDTAAELHQVSWLEVKATVDLSKHKQLMTADHEHKVYEVVYHIKFKGDAFGWRDLPVTFVVIAPNGSEKHLDLILESRGARNEWVEIVGGVFQVPADAGGGGGGGGGGRCRGKIEMGMLEVTSGKWKGGLMLAGITLRPRKSAGKDSMSAHA